jgi:GntR family transcriptional regulator, transcriptional repressor for pyruvate dehydrogenase complex
MEAAGMCAERVSGTDVNDLQERMRRSNDTAAQAMTSADDTEFHLAIARGAGNPYIHAFLCYLHSVMCQDHRFGVRRSGDTNPASQADVLAEHGRIVEAIEHRNVAGARRAMRAHLTNELKRVASINEVGA